MNRFKCKRLAVAAVLLVLALAIVHLIRTPFLQYDFAGTYLSGSGSKQLIFSVMPDDQEVYYADQDKGLYLWGSFESNGDKTYRVTFEDTSVIPEQTVVCKDTALQLQIGDTVVSFQKHDNIPTLVSAREN